MRSLAKISIIKDLATIQEQFHKPKIFHDDGEEFLRLKPKVIERYNLKPQTGTQEMSANKLHIQNSDKQPMKPF